LATFFTRLFYIRRVQLNNWLHRNTPAMAITHRTLHKKQKTAECLKISGVVYA
jgi:hypothetical protein